MWIRFFLIFGGRMGEQALQYSLGLGGFPSHFGVQPGPYMQDLLMHNLGLVDRQ